MKILFILIQLCLFNFALANMPVFDVSNFINGIKSLSQEAAQYRAMLKSLDFSEIQSQLLDNQFKLEIDNLRQLGQLGKLLAAKKLFDLGQLDPNYYTQLFQLDPDSTNYNKTRDAILEYYYHLPNQESDSLENKKSYEQIIESMKSGSYLEKKQAERREIIKSHSDILQNLGDTSALQTAQITASQLNLLLQQQEDVLISLSSLKQLEQEERLKALSAKTEEYQLEKERLLKLKQDSEKAMPPRSRWGDL